MNGKRTAGGGQTECQPFIPASAKMRELTFMPILVGTVLGMVFGASSLYLVLKVGLTVSASIPVAVISITFFRLLSKIGLGSATILENNIVQTAGSAGESIAFGIGVTMPAILILGFDLEIARVTLVAVLGGLLGILMMIPLRRALIVRQHGTLKYPEGTACAEVLKAGAEDTGATDPGANNKGAHIIFAGFAAGLIYKTCMAAFKGWKDIPEKVFGAPFKAGSISAEISPELLGVGYIIGPRLGAIMCGGGILAYLVLIPAIKFFGENLADPLPPGTMPIKEMTPDDIRSAYVLYIGAGAVAAGGIISLFRSLPIIWHGILEGMGMLKRARDGVVSTLRTEHDMSMTSVIVGIVVLVAAIILAQPLHMNLGGAILILIFGFLFSTVSSRLTGEIGSSSNPISGMTVATLLLTCLIFLVLGWTTPPYYITALSVGGIVCIAASNAGTTSQDLKTGHLIGATPRAQQIAILIGAFSSALILGPILLRLNDAATVYVPQSSWEQFESKPLNKSALTDLPPPPSSMPAPAGGPYRFLKVAANSALGLESGDYLVDEQNAVAWRWRQHFTPSLKAPANALKQQMALTGPQAAGDTNHYWIWQKTNTVDGPEGQYLVNKDGSIAYWVDPGINGTQKTRPDGSSVTKFAAPKATLMSYIIKGILSRELPWGLVLLGVMIAIMLEITGIPSLAFAVGVYLPLSSSTPILAGGVVRWLVDQYLHHKHRDADLSVEEMTAVSDKSPGVLMASGYIAGGAIAGIIIAFLAGALSDWDQKISKWSEQSNPFFHGPYADLLSMIPFVLLAILLWATGRELIFRPHRKRTTIP